MSLVYNAFFLTIPIYVELQDIKFCFVFLNLSKWLSFKTPLMPFSDYAFVWQEIKTCLDFKICHLSHIYTLLRKEFFVISQTSLTKLNLSSSSPFYQEQASLKQPRMIISFSFHPKQNSRWFKRRGCTAA